MGFDECYQLGNVIKTHGLNGEIVIHLDVDYPESYQEMESVLVDINGKLVPFFIESVHLQGDRAIIALEDLTDIDAARPLVGKALYLPLKSLPKLPSGGYYYHELIHFDVFDKGIHLGKVSAVYEMPTNYLMSIDVNGIEVLAPLEEPIIGKVDLEKRRIDTQLPDGLIDVYIQPDNKE